MSPTRFTVADFNRLGRSGGFAYRLPPPFRASRPSVFHSLAHSALMYVATMSAQACASEAPEGVASKPLPEIKVVGAGAPGVTERSRSYTTDAMSTATGLSLSNRETPQSVSVISRQMMDDQGVKTSADASFMAPGISVTRSDATRYAFSARGFAIDKFQFDDLTQPVLSPWEFGQTTWTLPCSIAWKSFAARQA